MENKETTFCILPTFQPSYSMAKIIQYLDELGFRNNPRVIDGNLYCPLSEETYMPEEFSLVGSYRFEGISDPEDLSVVYALQADNGTRVILVDAYGPYADPEVSDFISMVRDERQNSPLMDSVPPQRTIVISSKVN